MLSYQILAQQKTYRYKLALTHLKTLETPQNQHVFPRPEPHLVVESMSRLAVDQ